MKVVIVKPPLVGHVKRGTGVYTENLFSSLKKYTKIEVFSSTYQNLPNDVDIYHFPYFDPFFLTLPLFRTKKTMVTVHDLIPIRFPQHFPRGIRGEIKWQVQKYILKTVDSIITDSKASKKDIVQFAGVDEKKVACVYLAASDEYFQNLSQSDLDAVKKKLNLPDNFMLHVGEANWNKNVASVIKATQKANIPLVVVNKSLTKLDYIDHPSNKSLKDAVFEIKNPSLVKSVYDLNRRELLALYKTASCMIYPSRYEGFGLPVVEAFAAGCPVITSDKGSLKELVSDAAIVIDPEKVEDMIKAMQKIMANSALKDELIRKGKKQAAKFSWKKTAQETAVLYKKTAIGE